MRIVIVGDGKVGSTLAAELSKEDHDVVMIDRNPEVLDELVDRTDVSAVVGNGATLQSQRDAGVGESDLLIAATSADEVNILCCMLGRKLGVKHTIARVRNPEYADLLTFLKEELRLSMKMCIRDRWKTAYTAYNESCRTNPYPSGSFFCLFLVRIKDLLNHASADAAGLTGRNVLGLVQVYAEFPGRLLFELFQAFFIGVHAAYLLY